MSSAWENLVLFVQRLMYYFGLESKCRSYYTNHLRICFFLPFTEPHEVYRLMQYCMRFLSNTQYVGVFMMFFIGPIFYYSFFAWFTFLSFYWSGIWPFWPHWPSWCTLVWLFKWLGTGLSHQFCSIMTNVCPGPLTLNSAYLLKPVSYVDFLKCCGGIFSWILIMLLYLSMIRITCSVLFFVWIISSYLITLNFVLLN